MLTPPARQLTLPALDKRWNNGNERFLVPPDVFDPKRYRVDAVPQRDAKAFILQHHYKRDAAAASYLRYATIIEGYRLPQGGVGRVRRWRRPPLEPGSLLVVG